MCFAYKYNTSTIKKKYSTIKINDYFLEDNFTYVNNYQDVNIKSKKDLINFLYFTLNSGTPHIERYIDKSYDNYYQEIEDLLKSNSLNDLISIINDFVHPFNSCSSINIIYGKNHSISIDVNKIYSEEEIIILNDIVDNIINNNITDDMTDKEKIKVIHDYIINHTEYDRLKYENIDDNTYKSSTAYGVLVEGFGTCSGYADTIAIFLNKLGIVNFKISTDDHIWNLVKLDNKWYHLDTTWDDPISQNNVNHDTYFLIDYKRLKELNDGVHDFNKYIYPEGLN